VINKLAIVVTLTLCTLIVQGQGKNAISDELSKFYCEGWLIAFPDTIQVFKTDDAIPDYTSYSSVEKNDKGYYDLFSCYKEDDVNLLEESTKKLNLKFKDSTVTFKLGRYKYIYEYHSASKQLILIPKCRDIHKPITDCWGVTAKPQP
jgi:hypothetical protein